METIILSLLAMTNIASPLPTQLLQASVTNEANIDWENFDPFEGDSLDIDDPSAIDDILGDDFMKDFDPFEGKSVMGDDFEKAFDDEIFHNAADTENVTGNIDVTGFTENNVANTNDLVNQNQDFAQGLIDNANAQSDTIMQEQQAIIDKMNQGVANIEGNIDRFSQEVDGDVEALNKRLDTKINDYTNQTTKKADAFIEAQYQKASTGNTADIQGDTQAFLKEIQSGNQKLQEDLNADTQDTLSKIETKKTGLLDSIFSLFSGWFK